MMNRRTYTFKIGQQVYHHSAGGKRTGPYTVVGIVRRSTGTLYKIKSTTREQLAQESELKLVLPKAKLSPE
jgi:hypothetical protein